MFLQLAAGTAPRSCLVSTQAATAPVLDASLAGASLRGQLKLGEPAGCPSLKLLAMKAFCEGVKSQGQTAAPDATAFAEAFGAHVDVVETLKALDKTRKKQT